MPTKTQREREAEQRQAKLDRIREQVKEGSLVIRKMTDEERARFTSERPATEAGQGRRHRRRGGRATARPLPPAPRS
jgi:hypothetical protein